MQPLIKKFSTVVDLMLRVQQFLAQLQQQPGFVVVFSHSCFIKAMLWHLLAASLAIDAIAMQRFWSFGQGFRVPNASILRMEFRDCALPCWSAFAIDHLSAHLQAALADALSRTESVEIADQPS